MDSLRGEDPPRIGPFRLVGRLGAGGMGQVYLGQHVRDLRYAAVKVVHAGFGEDQRFRARFAQEVRTALRVRASWAAQVLDADPDAARPWLATEYVAGPSLERAVADHGPLPERPLGVLAARMATALAQLHEFGVVHRDVKPSNVLLGADGPKLIDFGIARAAEGTRLTQTGMVVGTPAFMSPEQAEGLRESYPSDVFSLASVLVFAANGVGPFGRTASPVAMLLRVSREPANLGGLPGWLRAELDPCLRKDAAERPTASELADRIAARSVTEDIPVHTGWPGVGHPSAPVDPPAPPSPPGPEKFDEAAIVRRPPRRRGWLRWVVAVAVVVPVVIGTVYFLPASGAERRPGPAAPHVAAPAVPVIPPAVLASPRSLQVPWPNTYAVYPMPAGGPVLVCSGRTLRVLDPVSFAERDQLDFPAEVTQLALPPEPNKIYVKTGDSELTLVDLVTKARDKPIPVPGPIDDLSLSEDGKRLVTVTSTGTLNVLRMDTGEVRSVPVGATRPTSGYTFDVDDRHAYVTSWDVNPGLVGVDLDAMKATPIDIPVEQGDANVPRARSPVLSPDGRRVYALTDRAVLVFDTAQNALVRRISWSGPFGSGLAVSRDGRFLFTATGAGDLVALDASAGTQVSAGRTAKSPTGMFVTRDNAQLYVGEGDLLEVFDISAFR